MSLVWEPEDDCECVQTDVDLVDARWCQVHGHEPKIELAPFEEEECHF